MQHVVVDGELTATRQKQIRVVEEMERKLWIKEVVGLQPHSDDMTTVMFKWMMMMVSK